MHGIPSHSPCCRINAPHLKKKWLTINLHFSGTVTNVCFDALYLVLLYAKQNLLILRNRKQQALAFVRVKIQVRFVQN